jgi:hypothetical protein
MDRWILAVIATGAPNWPGLYGVASAHMGYFTSPQAAEYGID